VSSVNDKAQPDGRQYWRSLDELSGKPEFKDWLHREFPQGASEWNNGWSRRNFLTLMGASLALAGLAGCRRPEEKIVPYVEAPEEIVPGIPLQYATTMTDGVSACGLVVESHEGRPTKIEGNKLHPSSRGKTDARTQAAILDMYDPDRSRFVRHDGAQSTWAEFVTFWQERFVEFDRTKGEGLAVLSEPFSSPSLAGLKREFMSRFPRARWVAWEPVADENIYAGIRLATGRDYQPVYDYRRAKVVLSLDSDFLLTESEAVAATFGFADGRRVESEKDSMNRLYMVEPLFTTTGAMADHRLRVRAAEVGQFALALAGELQSQGLSIKGLGGVDIPSVPEGGKSWLTPLAKDLIANRGESLVVAGRRQPAAVQALVVAINEALGNLGQTVTLIEHKDIARSSTADLTALAASMQGGQVSTLLMLGGNPVYNAPVDLDFAGAMKQVAHTIHLSSHVDETSAVVTWHINRAHFLEHWGDARAVDGTVSIIQPMIEPLFDGKSDLELAALIATGRDQRGYDLVRETWRKAIRGDFEPQWRKALHDGVLADSAIKPSGVRIDSGAVKRAINDHHWTTESKDLEVIFHPCYTLGDGRQANNGWLQELPDPITKLSWDNVATMSVQTARDLGVKNENLVTCTLGGREVTLPVWIVPGQTTGTVGIALGYGRTNAGRVGSTVGVNTYTMRSRTAPYFGFGLSVMLTGRSYELANVQDHGAMEGRSIVREATLGEYREHPEFAKEAVEHPPLVSLWDDRPYDKGYQWGMSIDLSTCTGCNACTVACQSENNIPIVGKEQVRNGREMHWIRIDRYFTGDVDQPDMVHQAMGCQHCENAPCEQVCPVAATVHDKEGLNTMVYNRCIGTRYCSNNCPYKVRRFNFFNYTKDYPEIVKMAQNPDVTVRSRGVMEKCSYCVQRINRVKKTAKLEDRTVRDGEIMSACQQACPADAIVFGNVNDPESRVSSLKKRNRDYALLGELNTKPRTTYLAKLRNPNPDIKA